VKLRDLLMKDSPSLVKLSVTVPAPASGNTNTVTVNHNFQDHAGKVVTPEVVIPVVRGNNPSREVHVYVVSVTSTQVTLRAMTSESTMTAVDLDLYLG
jgi:uncharacterized protein (DUF2252 family)